MNMSYVHFKCILYKEKKGKEKEIIRRKKELESERKAKL